MNSRIGSRMRPGRVFAALGLFLSLIAPAMCATEDQKFDQLQIGTQVYTNVTVTTKSKSYVFLMHSSGMTSLKVAELPADVLEKLGYENPNAPKVQTNGPAVWAKQTIAKLDSPQVKVAQEELRTKWNNSPLGTKVVIPEIDKTFLIGVALALLGIHLFYCFCCMLICKKADSEPGVLVWLPLLQMFPMLKAARMSGWWFLAFFVPLLNIVAGVLWCFKIADARGKTALVGFLLLLPFIQLFAFLYLAFSAGVQRMRPAPRQRPVEIMALETA